MRLSSDQVKQGILHPEKAVREEAVIYFAHSFSEDPTIMPVVIQALEKYGWRDGISSEAFGEGLVQTEETLVWLLTEVRRVGHPEDRAWSRYQTGLRRLLAAADASLLRKYEAELSHLGLTDTDFRAAVHDRIRLLSADSETCWRELESFAAGLKGREYLSDINFAPAHYLIEAIAREGHKFADRVLDLLAKETPDDANELLTWLQPLLVRLAGEMRLEPAVPLLIDRLHEDDDWLNEECQRSLAKIGTDETVERIAEAYPVSHWSFRLFASSALAEIHSDRCVTTCLDLLREEDDGDLQIELGRALLSHFAYDAVEPMRQMVLDRRNDPEILAVQEELVTACLLMGVAFPELQQWKDEIEDTRLWRRRALMEQWDVLEDADLASDEPDVLEKGPVYVPAKVGRNDPCPCGSGKKYKKCCMKKDNLPPPE
jgi:HEAT repeat protein